MEEDPEKVVRELLAASEAWEARNPGQMTWDEMQASPELKRLERARNRFDSYVFDVFRRRMM